MTQENQIISDKILSDWDDVLNCPSMSADKQLVSFGNYLLEKFAIRAHDADGSPYGIREVSDADLQNWKESVYTKNILGLPSAHQIGDAVDIDFNGRKLGYGLVVAVRFYPGKVKYDIEIRLPEATRILNIDSAFVYPVK